MISLNRDHSHTRNLREAFERAGARFNMRVETRQFAPACIMVAEGVGVAVVSPIDAAEYGLKGKKELEQEVRREITRLARLG